MKKSALFLMMAIFGLMANAAVLTVSNNPNSPGQYTTASAAITAASAGDTIYFHGSNTTYGNMTITKTLHLVGNGYYVNTQTGLSTKAGNIIFSTDGFSFAHNSTITGFDADNVQIQNCDDIAIYRNDIGNIQVLQALNNINDTVKNLHVYNNVVFTLNGQLGRTKNALIENNIIRQNVSNWQSTTTTVRNNVFKNAQIINNQYTVFANNIFYGQSSGYSWYYSTGNQFNVISNNLFVKPGGSLAWIGGNNSGGNNIYNQLPNFINAPVANAFTYGDDYRLASNSPGKNYGTDGTDIGIYGGNQPWPTGTGNGFQNAPLPNLPQLIYVNVLNPVVPAGQNLQVQIKARKQP